MRVMLLNDTATVPHVGCQAVSDAHARMLGALGHVVSERFFLRELIRFAGHDEHRMISTVLADDELHAKLAGVDAVIVNGEGTLHHGFGSEYLAVLGAAQRLGKMTLIVNTVYEANTGWQETLARLDDFCVRDALSLRNATQAGLRCRLVPDSALAAVFDTEPHIDLSDRIVITDWHPARDADVGEAMRRIFEALPDAFYFPLLHGTQAHLWRGAVASLSRASCVITGRHHGIYLAAAARRPFVAAPSNTAKVEGLLATAKVDIPVCTSADQILDAMQWAVEHLAEYERLFDYLSGSLPLSTFAALGRGSDATCAEREVERLAVQLRGRSRATDPSFWGLGRSEQVEARRLG